jgi:preprotein translocase subunit SecE
MAIELKKTEDDSEEVVENVKTENVVVEKEVHPQKATGKVSLIKRLKTFVHQIFDEMKKVVAPTRQELIEYTIVVLVFVLVIMLFITGVDVVIGKIIMALFAK